MQLLLQVHLHMNNAGAPFTKFLISAFLGWLSAEKPKTATDFVLADDGRGVAVADAVLIGEPVGALVTTEEGRSGFQVTEPL